MDNNLVGGHGQIVDQLVERVTATVQPGDTRVVLLRGPAGAGKSRIIREVYEKLRHPSHQSSYWPELPADEPASRVLGRKRLGPEPDRIIWPAGSLPGFGWWALDCRVTSTGSLHEATQDVRTQWAVHGLPLSIAKQSALGTLARLGEHRSSLLAAVRDAFVDEGKDLALDAAMGAANLTIPFAGTLLQWGVQGARAAAEHKQRREAVEREVDLGAEHRERSTASAQELADLVRELSCPEVPAVVVVEDLHLMGPELGTFIDGLTTPDARRPVLVLGTVWPEGEQRAAFAEWLARREGVETIDVPTLAPADLVELLLRRAPNTDESTALDVVAQCSTPLALELWLDLKRTQRNIERHDGAVVLTGDLAMPENLRKLLVARWEELPERTRESLGYATATDPTGDPLASFLPELVASVADADLSVPTDETLAALDHAADVAGWCRRSDGVDTFTDPLLARTAREQTMGDFDEQTIGELRDVALEVLRERLGQPWVDGEPARDGGALLMARWFRELVGDDGDGSWAWATATWLAAEQALGSGARRRAAELGDKALEVARAVLGTHESVTLSMDHEVAGWWGETGDAREAVNRLLAIHRALDLHHHNRLPLGLAVRFETARNVGRTGNPGLAVELLEELEPMQDRATGEHSAQAIRVRLERVRWLWQGGNVHALPEANVVLAEIYAFEGPDSPLGMELLADMADWYAEVGNADAVIELLDELTKAQVRLLGPDCPELLLTLASRAAVVGREGRPGEAVQILEPAITEARNRFGTLHPTTLLLRNDHAYHVCAAGDFTRGLELFRGLLPDQTSQLGETHLETLRTRNNIAFWTHPAGDTLEAVRLYEELLADQLFLGEGHPDLVRTQESLKSLRGLLHL